MDKMTPLNVIALVGIATAIAVIATIFSVRTARAKNHGLANIKLEDYYDEEALGTREVLSGIKHVFPVTLVQQIDITMQMQPTGKVLSVSVTAEFHRADFTFNRVAAEKFLLCMERALEEFNIEVARASVEKAFAAGDQSTIYVSPYYSRQT